VIEPKVVTASHILAHYATGYEAQRLLSGPGQLERARTEELLARYLPAPPARVLDVGGGPGVYSRWLVDKGYAVTLIDIVPLHVEQANLSFSELGVVNARANVGDARNLEVESETQDVVLLMGPLYHLPDRIDRLRALGEAWRVLKPGGLITAAVISRYASLLDGMSRLLVRDPSFVQILEADLRSGIHENPTDKPDYFTTAFLHHPDEPRAELSEADFKEIEVVGLEGPFWCLSSFEELWRDRKLRELMLGYLRQIEKEPSLLGASAHLLAIGRKAT
jgi:ubiquinone/menaquinone biosynthesis C-methylase UbiE